MGLTGLVIEFRLLVLVVVSFPNLAFVQGAFTI